MGNESEPGKGEPTPDWPPGQNKGATTSEVEQLSLSDVGSKAIGQFHAGAHDTEVAAAVALYPRSGTMRRAILDAFARAWPGGLTDWDLHFATGMSRTGAVARRNELTRQGWITKSAERRPGPDRKTMGIVWRLTDEAARRLRLP